jgi:uncharacterized BrkB/YihY/UPF0761 family membrane protein
MSDATIFLVWGIGAVVCIGTVLLWARFHPAAPDYWEELPTLLFAAFGWPISVPFFLLFGSLTLLAVRLLEANETKLDRDILGGDTQG